MVHESYVRSIPVAEYRGGVIDVVCEVRDCDVLIGVKEVNIEDLIEGKTFLFFSHTYKQQPYNAKLLAAILEKKVSLVDYEVLKKPDGRRIIGFGRWAGIVGAYNGLRAWGLREGAFELKKAIKCKDLEEMIREARGAVARVEMNGIRLYLRGLGGRVRS